jgi:hypothetical protein
MTSDDWNEKVEKLSLEPECIELRRALDKALMDYWSYFTERGMFPGFKISIGEIEPLPKRRLN